MFKQVVDKSQPTCDESLNPPVESVIETFANFDVLRVTYSPYYEQR